MARNSAAIIALASLLSTASAQFIAELTDAPSLQGFFGVGPNITTPFSVASSPQRQSEIAARASDFPYGPDLIPGGPFYLAINTSNASATFLEKQLADFVAEQDPYTDLVTKDIGEVGVELNASTASPTAPPFASLQDFSELYVGRNYTAEPDGLYAGSFNNGSLDLQFSMERLSISPYAISRLNSTQALPFTVDDATIMAITKNSTLEQLHADQRLFYIDHSDQGDLELQPGKYAGACQAYFYIDPTTSEFLPLAIKPNRGSTLIYTPQDGIDWLFAKIVFNQNDLWWNAWHHLMSTHEVIDLVYLAALRTFGNEHPVFAVFSRVALQTYVLRQAAKEAYFTANNSLISATFSSSGLEAAAYCAHLYNDRHVGSWEPRYLENDLTNRGLINSTGPALLNFPFYEDAKATMDPIRAFITSFVDSYYADDNAVTQDTELQAWVKEAGGPAQVQDFPASIATKSALVDAMTHFAYLASVSHHAVNTNALSRGTLVLPWHSSVFVQPLPSQKGLTEQDLLTFYPNLETLLEIEVLSQNFDRNYLKDTDRTLLNMFSDRLRLPRWNNATQAAEKVFRAAQEAVSDKIRARTFDGSGLSQGMPFVWTSLDPKLAPFYPAI